MQPVPQDLLKAYVQSQKFTSTADIMAAMKEMFRDVIQQVMEVELDEELGRERCQRSEVTVIHRRRQKPDLVRSTSRFPVTARATTNPKSSANMTAMPRAWRIRFCRCMPAA